MKKIFILLGILFSIQTVFSQNIIKAEYFIDADPGPGTGTAIPNVSQGDIVNLSFAVSTSNLSGGFHYLNTRVADVNGVWSRYETRVFYLSSTVFTNTTNIVGAEYFIDSDPGPGAGVPVNIGSPGSVVNFPVSIPSPLSSGFHFLVIRIRDQEGKWGLFEQRGFYVAPTPSDATAIVSAEYFYDTDPGMGSATPLIVNPAGDIITQTFLVPVPDSLSLGEHMLAIRVKDLDGHWSFFQRDTIVVGVSTTSVTCPGDTIVAAAPGQCSAIVNNIDPTVSPQGASYTYSLTGATTGNGSGTASGKSFNIGVTTVTYAFTDAPSTSCSFTVTVNSGTTASVSINTTTTSICAGQQVTFTATTVNGGNTPSYQWKLNGNNITAATNSTYQTTSLQNGDIVSVVMTSSIACASPSSATSNAITMAVHPIITPSVNITASATTICAGQSVTFTAIPTNGGTQPVYQWVKNGTLVESGSVYQTSSLANGDSVWVILYNTTDCIPNSDVMSNVVHITVSQIVTPSVTISVSPSERLCAGALAIFTAAPVSGAGDSPTYQWKRNGVNIAGATSSTYQSSSLQNGDVIRVEMTSSLSCANPQTVLSHDSVTMEINSLLLVPGVSISSSATAICQGQTVIFTAIPINGGSVPGYQWQLNGSDIIGATDSTYQTSSLVNGDKIKVVMTSSLPCTSSLSVMSNEITTTVNTGGTASVVIAASQTTICSGQLVTFTATTTNGGTNPAYEWTLNGSVVGSNSNVYQTTSLKNGDVVRLAMQPYGSCAGNAAVYSNSITMTVTTSVVPSVLITASAIDICSGQQVSFTANPTNGGDTPSYQWKLNGANIGGDSSVLHTSALANTDTVNVVMTSSLGCANPQTATSNKISMDVSPSMAASVILTASATNICSGGQVTFTATPSNGGEPTYEWQLNGNKVGDNSNTYQSSTLANGDSIIVFMTSSLPCANPKIVRSNVVVVTVNNSQTFYRDVDGDGYGNSSSGTVVACSPPTGFVSSNTDCDDNNGNVHPGSTEICSNAIDDNCNGVMDENCNSSLPVLNVKTYPVKEGDFGDKILDVTVTLDKPTTVMAAVRFSTVQEDATPNIDYISTSGWLYFPAGTFSAILHVKIRGDILRETNERFRINFSNPSNITLSSTNWSEVMIIDDDRGKVVTHGNRQLLPLELLNIPAVARRNTIWIIPEIGQYENDVVVMNGNGQVVSRFVNYRNQSTIGNLSIGLYFYRIQLKQPDGNLKIYSGRLMVTE